MPEKPDANELAALDAIIAASLVGRRVEDLTDDEILRMSECCPEITPQGRSILESLGPTPFSQRNQSTDSNGRAIKPEQFAGMYREGSDESLDPKLKAEMDKKRDEIRARLKYRQKGDV